MFSKIFLQNFFQGILPIHYFPHPSELNEKLWMLIGAISLRREKYKKWEALWSNLAQAR